MSNRGQLFRDVFRGTVRTGDARDSQSLQNVGIANAGYYVRVDGSGVISKVGVYVGASSGNISLAVYRNTGAGRDALPGARVATSGAVACPTAATYSEISLGSSVDVADGDWLFISADNTTATFSCRGGSIMVTDAAKGFQSVQLTAHPAPSTAAPIGARGGGGFILVGVA